MTDIALGDSFFASFFLYFFLVSPVFLTRTWIFASVKLRYFKINSALNFSRNNQIYI